MLTHQEKGVAIDDQGRLSGAIILLLCALLSLSTRASAQQDKAALTGLITDSSGAVIPGAEVVATGVATGVRTATVTNASGYYHLSLLPGEYTLTVSLAGFATTRVERISLTVNQTATVNLPLQIKGAQEEITVTAESPLREQRTASLGTTIRCSDKV